MLAIPVFRERVAPVLNWCKKVLIFPDKEAESASGREIALTDPDPFDLLRVLRKEGVETLICGALSSELLGFGEHLGMQIIYGVAGDIDEVLDAYRKNRLDRPSFRLPGCRPGRRYRGGGVCVESQSGDRPGIENATGRCGPGGSCICLHCGTKVRHEQGIPCTQIQCPNCKGAMVRE